MRLLDRRVHKNGATAAQIYGASGEKSDFCKFFRRITESLGESFQKRAATRRTRLVQHDGIYRSVPYFEALNVLPADVKYKFDFGTEIFGGGIVSNGLYYALVDGKGVFYEFFAVTRNRAAADFGFAA